jgi:mRNA interferase HigB
MRVIAKSMLRGFWERHPDAKEALQTWHAIAEDAAWRVPTDVKATYGKASVIGNNRVVFNICGNRYRLVVRINYGVGVVYTRFVGTHEEYDGIDAETV